jgi:putative membrane protein
MESSLARLIIQWFLNGLSLMIVAWVIPGIEISGFGTALIAAIVFGLVNATLGFFLKIITFPLAIITFGLFLLFINALMLKLAAAIVPGFSVKGCWAAFFGAILLSLINLGLRYLVFTRGMMW